MIKKRQLAPAFTVLYLLLYFAISLLLLEQFPLVHSDESWLAGLTRNMMAAGKLSVTEPFFDLKPRYPHGIKMLFHLMQMVSIKLFGYSVFSVRLISLLVGILFLYLFQKLIMELVENHWISLLAMIMVSLDIQFIYASHFARQEIIIAVSLCLCLWILARERKGSGVGIDILLGIITGLTIGIHPNSFFVAGMCGGCYLYYILIEKKLGWKSMGIYTAVVAAFGVVFVAISFLFDPNFITHYATNGAEEFGIDASLMEKGVQLFSFFGRLFARQSGTYYTPDIRFQLLLMLGCIVILMFFSLVMYKEETKIVKRVLLVLCGLSGLCVGVVLVGRYNQTSILFFLLFGWILMALTLELFDKKIKIVLYLAIGSILLLFSQKEIRWHLNKPDYKEYIREIEEYVPSDAKVIGNLNMDFYFANDRLRDYRNLPFALEGEGLSTYIEEQEIEYIVYTSELDYLYQNRPYYNVIYGNVMFVPELKEFCLSRCEQIGEFTHPMYGTRVYPLVGDPDYGRVEVYKVKKPKN